MKRNADTAVLGSPPPRVVSYHPLFEADLYGLAAGRDPGPEDEARMGGALAVVLPQGCRPSWYRAARRLCPNVFPNYDARFRYPGKTGQIRLFRDFGIPHPPTDLFADLDALRRAAPECLSTPPLPMPFVFKFAWGDEGRTVFRIDAPEDWLGAVDRARRFESTGQKGFLLQQYVPCANRSVRVAVIGSRRSAYWRMAETDDGFPVGVAGGARIDADSDPGLLRAAEAAADDLCRKTGINLAGLDLLFPTGAAPAATGGPLFIEINYYFGRAGIGGSDRFCRILLEEIQGWIDGLHVGGAQGREAR